MSEDAEIIPPVLYHYTNGDAFLSILNTNQLWGSHINFMNDKSEILFAYDILKEELLKKKKQDNLENINVDSILDNLKEKIDKIYLFVVSLSEKCDDLNQWRGYTNTNPGYCLGFKTDKLIEVDLENNSRPHDNSNDICRVSSYEYPCSVINKDNFSILNKCIYDERLQREKIAQIVNDLWLKIIKNEIYVYDDLAGRFLRTAAQMKKSAFYEEKEWRCIVLLSDQDCYVNYRQGKSYFIPFIKINIDTKLVLESVHIGPCPDMDLSIKAVKYLFRTLNIDENKVQKSKIPYRNW